MVEMICPLCKEKKLIEQKVLNKKFYKCSNCWLMFLERTELPDIEEEKSRYLKHNNDIKILKYRDYLKNTLNPVFNFIDKDSKILDYGSGYSKPIEEILKSLNYKNVESYDPIFFKSKIKKNFYDLIICNQVAEHFHHPMKEFMKIQESLKTNGALFISTNLWDEKLNLEEWFYIKDFTHVSIFKEETINWLSKCLFNSKLNKINENSFIILNRK